ncbi:2,3-bisphosphoglycerate-independent phosphoglycerate mutase [Thermodesulforhabdus norvegica]|uniref:2,3-bisphosphoglycerate-independent phosphoglycerate mutase n=1 Tax=Thermodesulforhabdus norvegica TaxID=39841 RepID=A0A1I4RHE3_9BACT|nr:2,3-bisphosphoglycerate-independent phosphoglycerate mutase [Thermodesulforhabdus norvegica]SFM51363.1 phosphoglycerate mutase [Thermodesulforhabdus norvegica]
MATREFLILPQRRPGPLVIVIMDGIGYREDVEGNAFRLGYTPHFDWLWNNCPRTLLKAHGTAVGLPSDKDMGNSEVGHNAIGAGRVYAQGARLVNEAIDSGRLFRGKGWRYVVDFCKEHNGALHFIGLFSDGNVHSHIDHLKKMIEYAAKTEGIRKIRIHILLDGRDVGETSALDYVIPFEEFLKKIRAETGADCRIASGGGRMVITMDRYEANWKMVELGWKTHVAGEGRRFRSAQEAIETYRKEIPGVIDQDIPPFVIADEKGEPVGPIRDGDGVIFFNFRGDRAIEISRAFEEENFTAFERVPRPKVAFAGMMEYDGDLHIPKTYLVEPPHISDTMGELLCRRGIRQMAIAETQKFGHVTYFWNGNRSGKFDEKLETYTEIPSDIVPFEQRPWMKAAEVTDRLLEGIRSGSYDLIRVNYANGDMVGHTGILQAAVIAGETVDLCLGRIIPAIEETRGILIVTADHGNLEEMFERDKKTGQIVRDEQGRPKAKTAHTLNPVPFIIYDPAGKEKIKFNPRVKTPSLTNIAATCFQLLGLEPPEIYDPPLLIFEDKGN